MKYIICISFTSTHRLFFVTEKAVELLGEDNLNPPQEPTVEEKDDLCEANNSQGYQLEIPEEQVDEIFTISDGKAVYFVPSTNSNYLSLLHFE